MGCYRAQVYSIENSTLVDCLSSRQHRAAVEGQEYGLVPVFAARCYAGAHLAVMSVCPSVCLSVRLSRSWILSKRINVSSNFSHHSSFSVPNILAIISGTTLTGASNARGAYKNHDLRLIYRFISELMQYRAIVTMEGE